MLRLNATVGAAGSACTVNFIAWTEGQRPHVSRHGLYALPDHARYVAELMLRFLGERLRFIGSLTWDDVQQAHRRAHVGLIRNWQ